MQEWFVFAFVYLLFQPGILGTKTRIAPSARLLDNQSFGHIRAQTKAEAAHFT